MRNILPSLADQRGLSRMPGARSIIPGSHFHCPLLLTHQKNLGPIKAKGASSQPGKLFSSFLLCCYLPLLIFFSPAIIPLTYFTLSFNPTSHHCSVLACQRMPFPSPIITALFSLFFSPIPSLMTVLF